MMRKFGLLLCALTLIFALPACEKKEPPPPVVEELGLICYCPCDDCTGYEIIPGATFDVEDLTRDGYEQHTPLWDPAERRMH